MTDPIEQTVVLLLSMSEDQFVKAVIALEQNTGSADVQKIRDRIRERIVKTRPPRRVTLARLFCHPFEEMLRNAPSAGSPWVPRSVIRPIWQIVEARVGPQVLARIRTEIQTLLGPTRQQLNKLGAPLWEAASKELGSIVLAARSGDGAAFGLFMKDEGLLTHAEVIAGACQVAPAIQELKVTFPNRPFEGLRPADREKFCAELKQIGAARRHDLRCILHVVAHWCANPAVIFSASDGLDLGAPTPLGKSLFERRENIVVDLLEDQIDALKGNDEDSDLDFRSCAERVRVAANSLDAADNLMKGKRNPEAKGRVAEMRGELGNIVKDRVVTAAANAVSSIWGGEQDPKTLRSDQIENAEDAARTMSKCAKIGGGLGVEEVVSRNIASTLQAIRSDVSNMISELKGSPGLEQAESAQVVLMNAARMVEILEGSDRAYEFFRSKETEIRAHT